jgi:hypothetical protein
MIPSESGQVAAGGAAAAAALADRELHKVRQLAVVDAAQLSHRLAADAQVVVAALRSTAAMLDEALQTLQAGLRSATAMLDRHDAIGFDRRCQTASFAWRVATCHCCQTSYYWLPKRDPVSYSACQRGSSVLLVPVMTCSGGHLARICAACRDANRLKTGGSLSFHGASL